MKHILTLFFSFLFLICSAQQTPQISLACNTATNKTVYLKTINGVNCGCYETSALKDTIPSINCVPGPCNLNQSEWCDQFFEGGLDNTGTSFRHTNMVFDVSFSDGSSNSFSIPSTSSWSDQVVQISDGLSSIMPWAVVVEPFCNIQPNGCGGLSAPILTLDEMFARYTGFRVCPGDPLPTRVLYTSDQSTAPRDMVLQFKESELIFLDRCKECFADTAFWSNAITCLPHEPICPKPCSIDAEELPQPECDFETELAFDCFDNPEFDFESNPDVPEFLTEPIIVKFSNCIDGSSGISYHVEIDGALEAYNNDEGLIGELTNENCESIVIPICRPEGSYTGRKKCYEKKSGFRLVEKQFDSTLTGSQTVDISAEFSLPTGAVIATIDNQLWTGNGTILATSIAEDATLTMSGSQAVCIRGVHGGAIPLAGGTDCFNSNSNFTFTGNLTDSNDSFTDGLNGCVTQSNPSNGASVGAISWQSVGPATKMILSTTNSNPANSIRFFVATYELVEALEYVSDDGKFCEWYDEKEVIDFTEIVEIPCEPTPPCDFISLGKMWLLDLPDTPGTLVEWWKDPALGGNSVAHDNTSTIFTNTGSTWTHPSGVADGSYIAPTFSVEGSNASDFIGGMGLASSAETTGTDQAKLSAYFFLTEDALLRDGGTRTGERGLLSIDNCCNTGLQIIEERTTNTTAAERGVFNNTVVPAGIHYGEGLISDLSAWWNLTLEASFDGGETYGPLLGYQEKPTMTQIPVIKCTATGEMRNAITDEILDPTLIFCESLCDNTNTEVVIEENCPQPGTITPVGSRSLEAQEFVQLSQGNAGPFTINNFTGPFDLDVCAGDILDNGFDLGLSGTAPSTCITINQTAADVEGVAFVLFDQNGIALPVTSSGDWQLIGSYVVDSSTGTDVGPTQVCYNTTGIDLSGLVFAGIGSGGFGNDDTQCDTYEVTSAIAECSINVTPDCIKVCPDPCDAVIVPPQETIKGAFDCTVSLQSIDTTRIYACNEGELIFENFTDTVTANQSCFDVPDISLLTDLSEGDLANGWNAGYYSTECPIYGDFKMCYTMDYDNSPSSLSIVNLGPKNSFWGNFGNYNYNLDNGTDRDWKLPRVEGVNATGWLQYQQISTCEVCIERVGSNIEYLHDGNSVYNGAITTTGPVYLNITLYGSATAIWGEGEINLFDFELCPLSTPAELIVARRSKEKGNNKKGLTDKEAKEIMKSDGLSNNEINAVFDAFKF